MGNRLESEISIPPTKEEMASLDKRELKVKWLRDGLRDRIRDVEKQIEDLRQKLDDLRQRHEKAAERLGFASIEKLVGMVIADCIGMVERIKQGGDTSVVIMEGVVPFIENHLGFDSQWETLHRTLKINKLPPRETSRLPFLPPTLDSVWQHLEALAPSAEMRKAHHALSAYLSDWHTGNRPNEHWSDKAFAAHVDANWVTFRNALGQLVEKLREQGGDAGENRAPARTDGTGEGGRSTAASHPKSPPIPKTQKPTRLVARRGLILPYLIDPAKCTITCKATGKSYYISGNRAVTLVNRLTDGMMKGRKGKTSWSVPFTDADARVFRKGRDDELAKFFRDCVERDPFTGHRIGNRQFADTAHLKH